MKIRNLRNTSMVGALLFALVGTAAYSQDAPRRKSGDAVQERPRRGDGGAIRERPQPSEGEARPQRDGAPRRQGRQAFNELTILKERLNLSEKQSKQVAKILEQNRKAGQKIRAGFQGKQLTEEQRQAARKKMTTQRTESNNKINALLNAEQAKGFAKLQKERQKRMEQRGGGERLQGRRGRGGDGDGEAGEDRPRRQRPENPPPR